MNQQGNQSMEIDVVHLLKKIWAKKVLILFTSVLFAVLSLVVNVFVLKPEYTATTRIYVVNKNSDNLTAQDLQVGGYLVNDYREIITSRDVLTEVVNKGSWPYSPSQLNGMISVSVPTDTRILSISVQSATPDQAQQLANQVRDVAAAKIKSVTQVDDVTTLEEAQLPQSPSSPNIKRNMVLFLLLGGFLATLAVLLKELLDDRVKRPEDVEEILGMTLLGVVPDASKL